MKQIYLLLAIFLFMTGCAENDPATTAPTPDNTPQVLAIRAGIEAQSVTKSIVNGSEFPASATIGVYVAKGSATDATGNQGAIGIPYSDAANNVKYILTGDEWVPANRVTLSSSTGTIYAYYPYNASAIISAANPSVPVTITTNATITVNGGSEATAGVNNPDAISTPAIAETDYMFYDPSTDASNILPKAVVSNRQADASLTMHHALAKISFRLVKNGSYSNGGALGNLTQYELADSTSKNLIITGGTLAMNLNDGTITKTNPVAGTITRVIQGYVLGNEVEEATIVSNLVVPITNFTTDDLKVTFTIDGVDYKTTLPVTSIQYWNAGSNYLYTVTLSGTDLSVSSVEIIDWQTMDGGDIAIK